MFRSPANIKVGRRALDAEVTEALEHTHPDLSFDWAAVVREPERARPDSRNHREGRGGPHQPPRQRPSVPERVPPPVAVVMPLMGDDSLLGRTLGAATAARLRSTYNEFCQRIGRRARSVEDRDRLIERLGRLNPDEWPDEAAIRAAESSVQAEWDAIALELPARHRGRRGGRNRNVGRQWPPAGSANSSGGPSGAGAEAPGGSGIIETGGNSHGNEGNALAAAEDRSSSDSGDDGGVGPDGAEGGDPAGGPGERLPGDR
jgi:hypothetical protein